MRSPGQMERSAWARLALLWEDAWDRVPGSKRIFLAIFLFGILAVLLAGLLNGGVYRILSGSGLIDEQSGPTIVDLLYLLYAASFTAAAGIPFTAALAGAALERARGNRIGLNLIARYRGLWPRLFVLVLIFMLVDYLLGLLFAPLSPNLPLLGEGRPTLTFWLLGGFTEALRLLAIFNVLDWEASVPDAIGATLRLAVARPLLILAYMVFSLVSMMLIGVTLGLAAIWLLPFLHIGLALLYLRYGEDARAGVGSAAVTR